MDGTTNDLLRATSRSFYLTLRVLPRAIRPQIGLAYLLARTSDTIADTEILPVDQRLEALRALRQRILGRTSAPLNFGELAKRQGSPAERELLEKVEDTLAQLQTLPLPDLQQVRGVLAVITGGHELDLLRFARASAQNIIALQTPPELDDYTYRVAGCVGGFWTKMCRAHLFPNTPLDEPQFMADGIRYGKGLQLVNILRDLPADLRNGRCHLPATELAALGLAPADLLDAANEPKMRPLYNCWMDAAEAHLAAGWNYTNTLPFRQFRVRLACAWPILIGMKTIEKLRAANVLDANQRVKISRGEVKWQMLRSVAACPFPGIWRRLVFSSAGVGQSTRKAVAREVILK
jgi:farnesyl-diphosphate farnesyltransferase